MVPYYKERTPGLPQWAGGMQASVVLDQSGNVSFTNLDRITGKVVVRCGKSADIESIVAKLEGESRTRLLSPTGPNGETPKPQFEYHKILYRIESVFPPPEVVEGRTKTSGKTAYTLPPGTHEYPFSFKIPFNNSCWGDQLQSPTIKLSAEGLEVSKPPPGHIKTTLPPTLSGFPGEAEIRYFVKATVSRRAFWKENPRSFTPFNFIPIEPPRPPSSGTEIFARQRHAFTSPKTSDSGMSKMRGLFLSKDKSTNSSSAGPLTFTVDARLPEPSILTCNKPIPLRILVKKLNASRDMLYLNSLQVVLLGHTKVRAHEVYRTETNSWVVMSKANMGMPLGALSDAADTEIVVDDHSWRDLPLPNTVAPSFQSCNIERSYQLDIRVGLTSSGVAQNPAKAANVVLPLRLDTKVFSGIAPPTEVLEAMVATKTFNRKPSLDSASIPIPSKLKDEGRRVSVPSSPIVAKPSGASNGAATASAAQEREQVPSYSDAPPSYEDAVGSDLPPVDAPRPDYAPPPPAEDDVLRSDEKRGMLGRRDS